MSRDTLSDLLRTVRLRGAAFYYMSLRGRWCAASSAAREVAAVMPGCEHVMEFHMIAKGSGWAAVSGLTPVRLETGDVVVFPQGDPHVLSSAPGLKPVYREPEWVLSQRDQPRPIPISLYEGVVSVGTLPLESADAVAVCGFLGCDLRPFNPLIAALPRVLHLPAARTASWAAHVINQAVIESNDRRPGGDALLERLAEIMFVDAARRCLESLPAESVGWLAGLRDRHVGKALALMHEQPCREWTLEELAQEASLSRSAFHERFVQYLGQPPMQYLTNWRIQLGARLLRESSRVVASIALEVGYESEAAFSRAFKRIVGMPPAAWRRAQAAN